MAASPNARLRSVFGAVSSSVTNICSRLVGNDRVWAFAVLGVLLLQASLVVIHEPWVDEWQALQIALLSPDLASLLENLRYEGHPPLWYLILKFVGLFVHPLTVLMVTQLLVSLSTQALILFQMPLSRIERLCLGLGYFILIEYGTLSRGHSLGALILIAFFVIQNRQIRWAMVILLPFVDFQLGLLSIAAVAILWREGERSKVGIPLWLLAAIASAWTVLPAADMVPALRPFDLDRSILRTFAFLSSQLIPLHVFPGQIDWGIPWPGALGLFLGMMFPLLGDRILRKNAFDRIIFHSFLWACVLFSIFIYPFGVRHFTLAPLLLIGLVAARSQKGGAPRALFRAWIAVGAVAGLFGAVVSFIVPFNVSGKAADFIRTTGLQQKNWVAWPDSTGVGLVSKLQMEIGSVGKGCTQAFQRWNHDDGLVEAKYLAAAFDRYADRYGPFYVSSPVEIDGAGKYVTMRRIGYFPPGYDNYPYYLYEVAYEKPATGLRPPRCAPERLPVEQWAIGAAK